MTEHGRSRRISPTDSDGEATCELTALDVARRVVPIDRLIERGEFCSTENGYEVRLPRTDEAWQLANTFADEESACCHSFAFEISERDDAIVMRAGHLGLEDAGGAETAGGS